MVTRVRIDAEGMTRDEVEAHLNAAFQLMHQNSVATQFTFTGPGYQSTPFGPTQVVPRESEFVEEVYESDIAPHGAIRWRGRRTIKFVPSLAERGLLEVSEAVTDVIVPIDAPVEGGAPIAPVFGDDLSVPQNT